MDANGEEIPAADSNILIGSGGKSSGGTRRRAFVVSVSEWIRTRSMENSKLIGKPSLDCFVYLILE